MSLQSRGHQCGDFMTLVHLPQNWQRNFWRYHEQAPQPQTNQRVLLDSSPENGASGEVVDFEEGTDRLSPTLHSSPLSSSLSFSLTSNMNSRPSSSSALSFQRLEMGDSILHVHFMVEVSPCLTGFALGQDLASSVGEAKPFLLCHQLVARRRNPTQYQIKYSFASLVLFWPLWVYEMSVYVSEDVNVPIQGDHSFICCLLSTYYILCSMRDRYTT